MSLIGLKREVTKIDNDSTSKFCSARQFDKVHASLEKGEKLLTERQKHILLAEKSDFVWSFGNTSVTILQRIPMARRRLSEQRLGHVPRLNKADV